MLEACAHPSPARQAVRRALCGKLARAVLPACLIALACPPVAAYARDSTVISFDGTPIVAHFYEAAGMRPGVRVPSVLVGPGYPGHGNTDPARTFSDQIGIITLRNAGFNVITWDPRGLGGSGGEVMFNSPDYEARDVQALIDYVARQPEALLDAPGDPRIGMSGSSYGGAIQFVSAAIDTRIDAIVPDVAWHSLVSSLFKEGTAKLGWLSTVVCGPSALANSTAGSLFGVAGPQIGSLNATILRACAEAAAIGRPSSETLRWFAERGPGALVERIRAPTLITHGTVDALFGLSEAVANFDALRRSGVPVKMLWYRGGHGKRLTGTGEPAHVARAGLAWLRRWLLRDARVDTGPAFEWLADDRLWRTSPRYPLPAAGSVDTSGAGSLTIAPHDNLSSTQLLYATPSPYAVDVGFPPTATA